MTSFKLNAGTPVARKSGGRSAHKAVQRAAMERVQGVYFRLDCEHWTTHDEQIFFAYWRPDKKRYWCTECQKWVGLLPKVKEADIQQEPLF